ncbi:Gfo/Idh/MocA family protein [Adhaeribacter radiodurans]|uniref:Gfo/Idh/MocA family oxidoreductase n=1 Tax=Adhaeribacter radiodurans TaxID=2745197 RepID=A0A7L7L489_9BACT|nr:Gfo/Idh/MocA family oxidoreductase [Adhaeribacter radiodurans]QMU27631.1 Gfo/Idh/MocA family oxidoreductase [Adhaeribacter radiodurans]
MPAFTRRQFLQNSSKLVAGAGLLSIPATAETLVVTKPVAPADQVRLGLIGCRGMGFADLSSALKQPDAACVALCDVDSTVLNQRATDVQKLKGNSPTLYSNYRKLLENKDIDAIIIGTPDHWHPLIMIEACQAGKDVYVEKPIANTVQEANLMVAAAKRYNRVVQVGQWQRSGQHYQDAINYVQSGKLGTIRLVKTWAYMTYVKDFPKVTDSAVPAGVDYTMWLGPAPKRPFNKNRFHGSFRYFWDYAGGLGSDWGVHMLDIALMGMKATAPKTVTTVGGKFGFPNNDGDTPDTQQTIYDFGNFTMLWEHGLGLGQAPYNRDAGVAFIGNKGTLVIDRSKWDVYPEIENGAYLTEAIPTQLSKDNALDKHTRNFLDCLKSRQTPNTSIVHGRNAALCAQLGNISYRLGRQLHWLDAEAKFKNDKEADQLMRPHYQNNWKLPNV